MTCYLLWMGVAGLLGCALHFRHQTLRHVRDQSVLRIIEKQLPDCTSEGRASVCRELASVLHRDTPTGTLLSPDPPRSPSPPRLPSPP